MINNDQDVVFQLSNLDHMIPKIYVQMVEIFQVSSDIDKASIITILTNSLSRALADHPILTGTLHFDNDAKRAVVKKRQDSSVALFVRGEVLHPRTEDKKNISLPSFSLMDRQDFPGHWLKADKVLPAPFSDLVIIPADDLSTNGPAVCGIQVTSIEGGLVLGLAVSHQVCDADGCETFLDNWFHHARTEIKGMTSSAAAVVSETPPKSTYADLGRKDLLTRGNSITEPKSQEAWRALDHKFPMYKTRSRPPSPPPASVQVPKVKSGIWHFPKSKLSRLKAICTSSSKSTQNCHISSYDAMIALLWRVCLRAKQPLVQADPATPSRAIYAVNARGRCSPALPEGYIGNGVIMPQALQILTISDVLEGTLEDSGSSAAATFSLLAQTVRGTTNSLTPEYISDLVFSAGNTPDLRWVELYVQWFLGIDCLSTSWHKMKSYKTHDFGFGTPAALRWPDPQFEGMIFVFPERTAKQGSVDEGLEVSLTLEESCYERLEQDKELALFAEKRGLN